jgi:hypothetical protein
VETAGQREGEWAHMREPAPTCLAHGTTRERERERERARSGLRRQAGPACKAQGARARAGLRGPTCAEMAFSISREFLIVFLFIFFRVFNSNSNQVSNSNQIKYMQQFKEYLDSI